MVDGGRWATMVIMPWWLLVKSRPNDAVMKAQAGCLILLVNNLVTPSPSHTVGFLLFSLLGLLRLNEKLINDRPTDRSGATKESPPLHRVLSEKNMTRSRGRKRGFC